MTKQELILDFIRQFRELGAENCFSNGMCYHFTTLLRMRFGPYENSIMYDQVANHFATMIDNRIYDITGDITDNTEYHWERWGTLMRKDPALAARIRRDCILKAPPDVKLCCVCPNAFYDEILNCYMCDIDNHPIDYDGICDYQEVSE